MKIVKIQKKPWFLTFFENYWVWVEEDGESTRYSCYGGVGKYPDNIYLMVSLEQQIGGKDQPSLIGKEF